jgi:hypothetical protein
MRPRNLPERLTQRLTLVCDLGNVRSVEVVLSTRQRVVVFRRVVLVHRNPRRRSSIDLSPRKAVAAFLAANPQYELEKANAS